MLIEPRPTLIQEIHDARLEQAGVHLMVKRLDLVHPLISGNKWFKLKYNLMAAREQGHETLLSFGGAYSNHIHALAAAGHEYGFNTIGVIRGEAHIPLNPMLQFAVDQGMRLFYLDRVNYRHKTSSDVIGKLKAEFGDFYLIPEGGSNALAVKGCAEIVTDIDETFDVIACACGTGGTLAGLVAGLAGKRKALGVAVLKGAGFLNNEVADLLQSAVGQVHANWRVNLDYHFGGYAKTSAELLDFIRVFEVEHGVPLEQVYTGKLMYGLFDMIAKGEFERGTRIVALHTGGLQRRKASID